MVVSSQFSKYHTNNLNLGYKYEPLQDDKERELEMCDLKATTKVGYS
jgi:hypothetical protein